MAVSQHDRGIFIAPIVNDMPQQIRICAARNGFEKAATGNPASVAERRAFYRRLGALYSGATTYSATLSTVTWTDLVVPQIYQVYPTSITVNWPALKSGATGAQMYWGASEEHGTGTDGSSAGFSYYVSPEGNQFLDDPALATSTTYQPVSGVSPSAVSTAVAVIFAAQ